MKINLHWWKEGIVWAAMMFVPWLAEWPPTVWNFILSFLLGLGCTYLINRLYFWKRWARDGYFDNKGIHGALRKAGMMIVYTCPVCRQEVTDLPLHAKKIHNTTKEKR